MRSLTILFAVCVVLLSSTQAIGGDSPPDWLEIIPAGSTMTFGARLVVEPMAKSVDVGIQDIFRCKVEMKEASKKQRFIPEGKEYKILEVIRQQTGYDTYKGHRLLGLNYRFILDSGSIQAVACRGYSSSDEPRVTVWEFNFNVGIALKIDALPVEVEEID